jgi:uncharacterized phage-associated protein
MSYDVRAIANLVLERGAQAGVPVTNITVNKIVFFLHAWYLAATGKPLVSAKIEAWNYGPVFRELYSEFKHFGRSLISTRATKRNPKTTQKEICVPNLDAADINFLEPLLDRYLGMSASKLVELSHASGGPWDQVYNHRGESNPGMHISDEVIKAWFENETRH